MDCNERRKSILNQPVKVINVGLEIFFESVVDQGVKAVHVKWNPPAGGDERLARILEKLQRT